MKKRIYLEYSFQSNCTIFFFAKKGVMVGDGLKLRVVCCLLNYQNLFILTQINQKIKILISLSRHSNLMNTTLNHNNYVKLCNFIYVSITSFLTTISRTLFTQNNHFYSNTSKTDYQFNLNHFQTLPKQQNYYFFFSCD